MSAEHEKELQARPEHHESGHEHVGPKTEGVIVDTLAADYVDESVVITPEENRRLRRKAYKL